MNKYQTFKRLRNTQHLQTAALLNYTQSAVSQTIKNFEKELGLELFIRSKNGMELKSDMAWIKESLRTICEAENQIARTAASLSTLDSGLIRIGTIQSISYHWLPGIIKDFSEEYPNILFQLTIGGFGELKEKLMGNELDCIFVSEFSVPGLPFVPLGSDELMLVTPLSHPLASHLSVSLADVNNQDFILSADGLDYETGKIFELNQISPNIRYQLNEDFTTLKMVEQGFALPFCQNCFSTTPRLKSASARLPSTTPVPSGSLFRPALRRPKQFYSSGHLRKTGAGKICR